jgi:menaquinol-cytochrome c reductase iron-sulfur subunit
MSRNQNISRRDFIKATSAFVGGLIGVVVGLPTMIYLLSPSLRKAEDGSVIEIGPLENFPIDIPTRVEFTRIEINGWERTGTNYGLYVVRRNVGEVRVFSDICTHLGCRVTWDSDQGHYISPCHDGHFDILGNVVSGPPPRPLDEYITTIENGNLLVTLPPIKRHA